MRKTTTSVLLAGLIAIDLAFIVLDLIYTHTRDLGSMYSLGMDRGYGEYYQYLKLAAILFMLGVMAWRERALFYAGWFLVFTYLLIDDAFLVHETYGLYVAERVPIADRLGLRGRDFGELLITMFAGGILIVTLSVAYLRSDADHRALTHGLVGLILVLAFFGVLIDMIHEIFRDTIVFDALGTLEDGGELVVMSVITWFVFRNYHPEGV